MGIVNKVDVIKKQTLLIIHLMLEVFHEKKYFI